MAVASGRRLAGLRFEDRVAVPPETLPRMDVAVFVGFAASGPLDRPVLIEDVNRFRAIFGADVELAWDRERGRPHLAYLASAIRSFFRNGGRRCWVIRVAGRAATASFEVPGLARVNPDGTVEPAVIFARSPGSWVDTLRVGTALLSVPVVALSPLRPDGPSGFRLDLAVSASSRVGAGDLLRLSFGEGQPQLMLAVGSVGDPLEEAAPSSPPTSPPSPPAEPLSPPAGALQPGGRLVRAGGQVVAWVGPASGTVSFAAPDPLPGTVPSVERLTFELWVRQGGANLARLPDLGFNPGHPRYWGDLPTDAALYDQSAGASPPDLWRLAAAPRFPLTGSSDDPDAAPPGRTIPLGMDVLPGRFAPPHGLTGTALERDGLDALGAGLFLDPGLVEPTTAALLQKADALRYSGPSPRRLTGIHAALDVEEATIIAVPDALHPGWVPAEPPTPPEPVTAPPLPHPEWWHFLDCDPRAEIPIQSAPDWGHFQDCTLAVLDPPTGLAGTAPDAGGTFTLSWQPSARPGAQTLLEEASRPDFAAARTVYVGTGSEVRIYGRSTGAYYYRARTILGGTTSDWSVPIGVSVLPADRWVVDGSPEAGERQRERLLAVQRGLLRLGAARGDLVAVLDLPESYRAHDAERYLALLRAPLAAAVEVGPGGPSIPALGFGEAAALSYGAAYHPWPAERHEQDDSVRIVPPSGSICGLLAERSLTRGAWIAPANQPLDGVVALTPPIGAGDRMRLQEAGLNLLRSDPRGFLTLGADTLAADDLRPLNVRRLLILLRRLALRRGASYVFEPNDEILRRSVQRGFEAILGDLFARGAFAGATPRTSFQVVAGGQPSRARDLDAGRFIVELRVAPSLPMSFLTIRLIQSGDRALVVEER